MIVASDFEGAGSRYDFLVLDGVFDGPEAILDGVLDLADGVAVGPADQKRHRTRVRAVFDESEFVLAQHRFVNQTRISQAVYQRDSDIFAKKLIYL